MKNPVWISSCPGKQWVSGRLKPARDGEPDLIVTEQERQKWDGFGGCFNELGWRALTRLSAREREDVMRRLFDAREGCGFTLCRVPIGASDYAADWYSLNETRGDYTMRRFSIDRDQKGLIPYIREALAIQPALSFFASPWSPPTWMKSPPVYNYGTLVWNRKNLEAYALYLVRFVQAYRTAGIPIRQIHPQNEPLADQKFPSCLWTGEQLREFIRDFLGPAFERHGVDAEIWLGTLNTDDFNGYVQEVLCDREANRYVAGVGFQWAGKGAIQRTHASWPDKRLMQTENECGDGRNSWSYAEYVFGLMHHYITNGANAYVYWNMVLDSGGVSTWGWKQNSMVTVDPRTCQVAYEPEFHLMRHFAGFVRPGAVCVGVAGSASGNALAFKDEKGARAVLVHNAMSRPRPFVLGSGAAAWACELAASSFNTFVLPGAE